jgi:hypothetical protein
MSAAAIADHIDDDIFIECLAILERYSRNTNACLRVISVNVEDRSLD